MPSLWCGWTSSNQLNLIITKGWPPHKEEGTPPTWLLELVFSCLWTWAEALTLPGSRACWRWDWDLYHLLSWFPGLQTHTEAIPLALPVPSLLTTDIPSILFFWRTLTNALWLSWPPWQNMPESQGPYLGPSMAVLNLIESNLIKKKKKSSASGYWESSFILNLFCLFV